MWCKQCQQDVPSLPTGETGKYVCPRCGVDRGQAKAAESARDFTAVSAAEKPEVSVPSPPVFCRTPDPPRSYDPWELDEQLRHLQRILAAEQLKAVLPAMAGEGMRIDPGHAGPGRRRSPASLATRRSPAERSALQVVAWFVVLTGLMGMACGGVLLGWSLVAGRQELWPIGLPIALVGQIVLVMGFVLQMDRLWNDHRRTSAQLGHMDERLADIKSTTALLGTTHSTPAASFYSHLAAGANPQFLLADLKSQLDLLAMKIGRDSR